MTPTSLVTGCSGFIGSHVAEALLRMGHDVVGIDDLSGGFIENNPTGLRFYEGSITDAQLLDEVFHRHNIDHVFHLAAYAAEGLSHFIRRFNYENNLIGSINLINASVNARTVKCFVFTSSIAVYGENAVPMKEEMHPLPMDPYGIAKYAVERDLQCAREMFGLDYIIFRPHNVYGERQNIGDRYRNVIGIFMNQLLEGKPLTIFGDGTQTRAFSHIDNVAPVIARSIEYPAAYNEIFNIGADTTYTVNELADAVARSFGVVPDICYLEKRSEAAHAYASHEKLKRIFGDLLEEIPLDEGIDRMRRWAQRKGNCRSRAFEAVEVSRNLPEAWKSRA